VTLTLDQVRSEVGSIREMSDDDEAAHTAEDRLHKAVLVAIAAGAPNAAGLASAALKTLDIEFQRWCA